MTATLILAAVALALHWLGPRAVDAWQKARLAKLSEDDRIRFAHFEEQFSAAAKDAGFVATLCAFRSATLIQRARALPSGPDRSRVAASALRWHRRSNRWHRGMRRERASRE